MTARRVSRRTPASHERHQLPKATALLCGALIIESALSSAPSLAGATWISPVDSATWGAFDESNPVIAHGVSAESFQDILWMVCERHSESQSQIVGARYRSAQFAWDSSLVVLSASPLQEDQKYAQCQLSGSYPSTVVMRMAAWQRWKDNRWQLYYSTLTDSAITWSEPQLLCADSLDNTAVRDPAARRTVRWS